MASIEQTQDTHLKYLERCAARLSAVAEAGRQVGTFLELEPLLQFLIEKALEATGGEAASIMLLDESTQELKMRAHRGVHPYHAVAMTRRVGEGISGWVAETGEPLHLIEAVKDDRFHGVYADGEIVDALCVPLKDHASLVGVLSVNHHATRTHFSEEDLHALLALGGYAAAAIRNAQTHQQLQKQRKVQEHLLEKLITAQEDERKRIAADIHDGPAQALAALQYRVEAIDRLLIISPERARVEILKLGDQIRKTLQSLRQVLVDLRPSLLDDLGLIPALRQHLEGFRVHSAIQVAFAAPSERINLDPGTETVIYRVIQEALTNVSKHARATKVQVRIHRLDDSVLVVVEDNGRGFDPDARGANGAESLGLAGMRERARMVGGTLKIESMDGTGTKVVMEVPLVPVQRAGFELGESSRGEEDYHGSHQRARGR